MIFPEGQTESRSVLALHGKPADKLSGHVADKPKSHGTGASKIEVSGESLPVVGNLEQIFSRRGVSEADPDDPFPANVEGVLEGIGDELGDDEAAGDDRVRKEANVLEVQFQLYVPGRFLNRRGQGLRPVS